MTPIAMKLANACQKDTDTALAIGGLLNDLDDCNSAFRHCSIRTLEFIDGDDAEEQAENPLEDFDPEDGEHCKIFVDRLLKLLDRSPGCLNRVLWGYSSIRDNNLIDLNSDHLAFHPEIVAAKEKAAQLEWLWKHCKIIFWPQRPNAYPIEHAPAANKDGRWLIEAEIAGKPIGIPPASTPG